jgi:hypothetical protein
VRPCFSVHSLRGCEIRDEGAVVLQRCVSVNKHLSQSLQFLEYVCVCIALLLVLVACM